MCSFIAVMPSMRIYNVNSHENKEKIVVYVYMSMGVTSFSL